MSACPTCGENFNSYLSRESHYKLYPRHAKGEPLPPSDKEEAILTLKKTKRRKNSDE